MHIGINVLHAKPCNSILFVKCSIKFKITFVNKLLLCKITCLIWKLYLYSTYMFTLVRIITKKDHVSYFNKCISMNSIFTDYIVYENTVNNIFNIIL